MPTTLEMSGAFTIKRLAAAKMALKQKNLEGMKLIPMVDKSDATKLVIEREHAITGIQASRGLMGATRPVKRPGSSSYEVTPAYFGENICLTENDLINRRRVGTWDQFDSQGELTTKATDQLFPRFLALVEKNIWDLLQDGFYAALDDQGKQMFFDIYRIRPYTADIPFTPGNAATATPLKFFRETLASLEYGATTDWRSGEMWMNRKTLNAILGNTNPNDMGGKRYGGNKTFNSDKQLNEVLLENDLPTVKIYNEGYIPDGGLATPEDAVATQNATVRFVRDGKIVMLGKREDGEPIGEYWLTRTAQNGGKGGYWTKIDDKSEGDPPHVKVSMGHNGGPLLDYAENVASLTVF